MYPVVPHLEGGDAGTLAFADLHLQKDLASVLGELPKRIQFGVVAARDDATVANEHRRTLHDRLREGLMKLGKLAHVIAQLSQTWAVQLGQGDS